MARSPQAAEIPRDPDTLEGIAPARERDVLIGHGAAEQALLSAYRSGRIHHGWLIGGPEGIGKATLAFRFARFILAHPDPAAPEVRRATDLSVPPDHPVARRIRAGAHIDLVHLRRPWDDKAKRFRTELTVDEVHRATRAFGSTAGEGGWRIAIVDTADDMNANAANALLKTLEEPPARALFLVLSHQPGRLLPTIRSRCRKLALSPLTPVEITAALADLGVSAEPDRLQRAMALADGSLRRVLTMLAGNALDVAGEIDALAERLPRLDVLRLHALADRLVLKAAEDDYRFAVELILAIAETRARLAALSGDTARAARWADTRSQVERGLQTADIYNLDKRAALLASFEALVQAATN